MNASRLALLSLGVLQISLAAASAAPITLYDGSSSPTSQGWNSSSWGLTETAGAGTREFNTTNESDGLGLFRYATGASEFVVSIRLQVAQSSFNHADAGLFFSPSASVNSFSPDRLNSVIIGEGSLQWGDLEGGSYGLNTTTQFHEYALRYQGGQLDFFVDASFDDIVAGTAVAVLSRTNPALWGTTGMIAFGDGTNDPGVNSRYTVDFVKFEELTPPTPVPEPGTITLLGLGIAGLAARRKRRAPKVE